MSALNPKHPNNVAIVAASRQMHEQRFATLYRMLMEYIDRGEYKKQPDAEWIEDWGEHWRRENAYRDVGDVHAILVDTYYGRNPTEINKRMSDIIKRNVAFTVQQRSRAKPGVASLGGPSTPYDAMKAMLGAVVPILGKYAMSVALQWLNPEVKFTVVSFNGTTDWSTTPLKQLLNGIAQGVDVDERIGNSIRILGLEWDVTIIPNSAASSQTLVQVVILVDTQTEGAAPPTADVYSAGITSLVQAPVPNINTALYRFAILHHERFTASTTNTVLPYNKSMHVMKNKLDNLVGQDLHTLYQGTTAAITDISKGSIYLVAVSNQATNTPTVTGQVRVFYEDD